MKKSTSPFVYNTYMSCFVLIILLFFHPGYSLKKKIKLRKPPTKTNPTITVFMSAKLISNLKAGTV